MIVNTAYMYMGKKVPTVNPNIWESGTVNYPYNTSGNASFIASENRFVLGGADSLVFTLPLKKFTKITFSAASLGGLTRDSIISVIKNGLEGGKQLFKPNTFPSPVVFNIPAEYQEDNVQVKILAGSNISLTSGVMS